MFDDFQSLEEGQRAREADKALDGSMQLFPEESPCLSTYDLRYAI